MSAALWGLVVMAVGPGHSFPRLPRADLQGSS